ncbi:MAG TPA: hypothetical protein VGN08_00760 [Solirubrobacteraceae bacterium]|jgi:hypothetical protein
MGGSDCDSAEPEPGWKPGSARLRRLGGRPVGRAARRVVLALSLVTGLALYAVPALASADTLHKFSGRIVKGEGLCAFTEPKSVAVNNTTGEIWVIDHAKARVDRLSPTGACLSSAKVFSPEFVSVDQNTGDAYVAVALEKEAEERFEVVKFNSEGKALRKIKKWKNAEKIEESFEEHGPILGLGVDASGSLWVYQGEVIQHFSNAEPNKWESAVEAEAGACSSVPGFAVSPDAQFFYVGRERETRSGECTAASVLVKLDSEGHSVTIPPGEGGIAKAQLDNENTTGVAVDNADQVYFDNVTNVSSFNSGGEFVQRFANEPGEGQLQEGTGVAAASNGDVYVADLRAGAIKVYGPAKPEQPVLPQVADGRAYEQVTPQNKLGATIYPISKSFGMIQAAEDGNAITFISNSPPVSAPPTNRAPEPTQNLSRRGSSWGTETIATPAGRVPAGYASESGDQYEFFTPDLAAGLANPQEHESVFHNEPLLSPDATEGTPYRRNLSVPGSECEPVPSGCYVALVSGANDTASPFVPFGGKVHFTSAAPDLSHAVLRSEVPLTAEASAHGQNEGLYETEAGGGLQLVSILPAGEAGDPSAEGTSLRLGGPGENNGGVMRNAISKNGSRVIWSTERGAGKLYLRDTAKHETLRIDTVPTSEKTEVAQPETGAQFQTANVEGSKIFFTDTQRLMKSSTVEPEVEETEGLGDLYVCDVVEGEGGKLGCELKDLTAEVRSAGESAAVQGVLGAGDEGNTVYYVANGVLSEDAGRGGCEPRARLELQNRSCNLYAQHFSGGAWHAPKFVASLAVEDQNDWHIENEAGALTGVTSRVSPNGTYLSFMSNRSLTGYNNVDTSKAANGARDEEVYLYNSETNFLQCPSCNPGGAPPTGILDKEESSEGIGLLIDRPELWTFQWVAANIPGWTSRSRETSVYQSRYLSNSGRLFFNSVSPLVPADENGKADVYEFEPKGEGSCTSSSGCISLISSGKSTRESAFLDASASGNDVFFLTSEQLAASDNEQQDLDSAFDIYDARVCGSAGCVNPPPPPHPCTSEATCKPGTTTVAALPGAPPSSLPGSGNAGTTQVLTEKVVKTPPPAKKTETRAQKLAKALKACKKLKKKSKRNACIRAAHKKYDPPKKKSKSHKASQGVKR